MSKQNDKYYPKTKAEFDAYCRAVDEANEMAINSAIKRDKAKAVAKKPTAKKTGKK